MLPKMGGLHVQHCHIATIRKGSGFKYEIAPDIPPGLVKDLFSC